VRDCGLDSAGSVAGFIKAKMSSQFHRRRESYLQTQRLSSSLGVLFMESVVSKVHCSVSTLSRTMPSACNIVLTPTVLKQVLGGLRQNLPRLYGASQWVIHFTVMCKSGIIIQTSNTRRCMSVAPTCVQYYSSLLLHPSTIKVCIIKTKLNSVALVRERTIPTERPPPVGEVSANFCG
jgi:hypothetical protein